MMGSAGDVLHSSAQPDPLLAGTKNLGGTERLSRNELGDAEKLGTPKTIGKYWEVHHDYIGYP